MHTVKFITERPIPKDIPISNEHEHDCINAINKF